MSQIEYEDACFMGGPHDGGLKLAFYPNPSREIRRGKGERPLAAVAGAVEYSIVVITELLVPLLKLHKKSLDVVAVVVNQPIPG